MVTPLDEITGSVALADINQDDYRLYVETSRLVAKTTGLSSGASGLIINVGVMFYPFACLFPPPDTP